MANGKKYKNFSIISLVIILYMCVCVDNKYGKKFKKNFKVLNSLTLGAHNEKHLALDGV